ncbi:MAG TPA: hypothetical protein VN611_07315 [Patescibacteria group bacterium]|nr:hypothetical protein [Patescibacteria group bacterium]
MGLKDDDKEYLKQLAWIYPADFIAEVGRMAEQVIIDQLSKGERQHIRDIIRDMFARSQGEESDTEWVDPATARAAAEAARQWQETVRNWLQEGKSSFVAGLGPEVVTPLLAIASGEDREMAGEAETVLASLNDAGAIDAFCSAWGDSRSAVLTDILLRRGYLASREPRLRLLTLLKTGAPKEQYVWEPATVDALVAFLDDPDPEVAARACGLLQSLPGGTMTDALCDLALAQPGGTVEELALGAGYAPRDEERAALFYCLTRQWEKYKELDLPPAGLLLRRGYAAADEALQRRVLTTLRSEGYFRLLLNLLLAGEGMNCRQLTEEDWAAVTAALLAEQDWPEVWRLLTKAPVFWSARLWNELRDSGWTPSNKVFWQRLQRLDSLPRELFVPDGRNLTCLKADDGDGRFTCLAFHPQRQLLVAGDADGRVFFWRQDTEWPWRMVNMHHDAVTSLTFSPDGRRLATAGREGRVLLWDFPSLSWQETVKGQKCLTEGIILGNDGSIRALSREKSAPLRLWDWDGRGVTNRGIFSPGLFPCLAVHPDREYLVSGGVKGAISLCAASGRVLSRWQAHSGPVRQLAISGNGRVLATMAEDGELICWLLPEGRLLWCSPEPVTGALLALSYAGDTVALAAGAQVQLMQVFWSKPLAVATHADWRYATEQREPVAMEGQEFLRELLQEKFQYDFCL